MVWPASSRVVAHSIGKRSVVALPLASPVRQPPSLPGTPDGSNEMRCDKEPARSECSGRLCRLKGECSAGKVGEFTAQVAVLKAMISA